MALSSQALATYARNDAPLPSASTAYRLVRGDATAIPYLVRDMLGRAALAGIGIKLLGASWRDTAKYAIASAIGIEIFVLGYAAYHVHKQEHP